MKIIILSQPKAGTYLTANILKELGLLESNLHIDGDVYFDYKLNTKRVYIPLENILPKIKNNHFAVGHITFSKRTQTLLYPFKKILVLRDYEQCVNSMDRFEQETGIEIDRTDHELIHNNIAQWQTDPEVFVLRFNELLNRDTNRINELQQFLFGNIITDSTTVLESAINSNSPTKSQLRQ